MTYKCAYGCTKFNPLCDACDDATTSDSPYDKPEVDKKMHIAALHGMTLEEAVEDEFFNFEEFL